MIYHKTFYITFFLLFLCISKTCGKEIDTSNKCVNIYIDKENLKAKLSSDLVFETAEATTECFCGNHSLNCVFKNGLKVCTCKDGFVPGINEVCIEMCSELKKCQNGGTCHFGLCRCPPRTEGTFCEKIRVSCPFLDYYEEYSRVRGLRCCCPHNVNSPAKCKYDVKALNAYCECPNKGDVYEDRSNTCKECNCGNNAGTWSKCDFYGGVKTCFCKKNYEYNPKTQICEICNCGELSKKCEFTWKGFIKCDCIKGTKQNGSACHECNCGDYGFCELRDGKPNCQCLTKFQNHNGKCIECNCGKHGKCIFDDTGKKVKCECDVGYSQNSVGECRYCYCGDNTKCAFNADDTKNCSCPPGYRDVNGFCTDIHECDEGIATCLSSEICKNIPGGAFCACADGYRKTYNGCEDIDECAFNNPCKNEGTECVNTPGSYECRCETGYSSLGGQKSNLECQGDSAFKVACWVLAGFYTVIIIILSFIIYRKKYRWFHSRSSS